MVWLIPHHFACRKIQHPFKICLYFLQTHQRINKPSLTFFILCKSHFHLQINTQSSLNCLNTMITLNIKYICLYQQKTKSFFQYINFFRASITYFILAVFSVFNCFFRTAANTSHAMCAIISPYRLPVFHTYII